MECLILLEPTTADKYDVPYRGSRIDASTASVSNTAPKFCGTQWGGRFDNPTRLSQIGTPRLDASGRIMVDGDGMTIYDGGTQDVKEMAVVFEFRNVNVMKVTYSVQCCTDDMTIKGRAFIFSGAVSPLMPCELPPPSPPTPPSPPLQPSPPHSPPPPSCEALCELGICSDQIGVHTVPTVLVAMQIPTTCPRETHRNAIL